MQRDHLPGTRNHVDEDSQRSKVDNDFETSTRKFSTTTIAAVNAVTQNDKDLGGSSNNLLNLVQ